MLSIGSMSPGQGAYYIGLASGDYYTKGGEPPGQWYGAGADRLGLTGVVEETPFYRALTGIAPDGKSVLVKAPANQEHHPGWDLTFSAPKSVSVVWSQADEATRQLVAACHEQAVKTALDHLAATACFSRRGKGGQRLERVDPVFALFTHGTSRAEDPQLHTHALALNVGVLAEGGTGAVAGRLLYDQKMALGALYRAELAYLLQTELGLRPRRHGSAFELDGVPQAIIDACSKRRQAVLRELKSRGFESAQAAATATVATRTVKVHRPRGELLAQWQAVGRAMGFTADEVRRLQQPGSLDLADEPERARQAAETAVDRLIAGQNYFTMAHLIQATSEEAQWCGAGAAQVIAAADEVTAGERVIEVGTFQKQAVFTTQELLDLEAELFERAGRVAAREGLATERRSLTRLWARLSEEQQVALGYLLGRSKLGLIDGLAGTGKTTLLRQARRGWELGGRKVLGAAVSAAAAKRLGKEAGMRAMTVEELIRRLGGRPAHWGLSHHAGMLVRAARRQDTWAPWQKTLKLGHRSVVVIDEASMINTRDLHFLMGKVERAGAKLVLLGDRYQLPAIGNGGCFAALADKHGAKRLKAVRRQRDKWAREAVQELAEGDVAKGLKAYAERGFVHVAKNREEALNELLREWSKEGVRAPRRHLMLVTTNREAAQLNAAAQAARKEAGQLGRVTLQVAGTAFHRHDRVVFRKNAPQYGVDNGDTGTILMLDPLTGNLIVNLDRGGRKPKVVGIPTYRYQDVQLGYAVTTHSAQGGSFDHVYVMAGGFMQDREMAYTQLSRAKQRGLLFCGEQEAGAELAGLASQYQRSREQVAATELRNSERRREARLRQRRYNELEPDGPEHGHSL